MAIEEAMTQTLAELSRGFDFTAASIIWTSRARTSTSTCS